MPGGKSLDSRSIWIIFVSLLLGLLLHNATIFYPFRLFTTLVHEVGHGVAAELTGGDVVRIQIAPNAAGVCFTTGGIRFVVVAGGYLGSALFGGLLLYLSSKRKIRDYLLESLAALFLVVVVLAVRDLFTFGFSVALVAALFVIGLKTNPAVEFVTVKFLATITGLYALYDVKSLVLISLGAPASFIGGVGRSDADAMADMTGIPAVLWALAWGGLALWFLVKMAVLASEAESAKAADLGGSLYGADADW